MNISIRPAGAEDAPFLAWVMLAAARSHLERGLWDAIIGGTEADALDYLTRLALTETRSWGHYSGYFIAEVDGQSAAALCGYDPRTAGTPALMQAMNEVADALEWDDAQRMALGQRFAPIATCVSDDAEGAWIVECVATLPAFRRRGLVDRLLRDRLAAGRANGHRLAQITVMIGNTPAQRAYEKVGFAVDVEKRHPDFEAVIGEPGLRRMTMEL